jgi:hypothetical protein
MPISMLDSPIRCCLPEEEFLLVNAHEKEVMHSYRGFALGFLPHHPCISRLMVALGISANSGSIAWWLQANAWAWQRS